MPGYNLPSLVTLLYINQALLQPAICHEAMLDALMGPGRNQLVKVTGLNGWVNWGLRHLEKDQQSPFLMGKSQFLIGKSSF